MKQRPCRGDALLQQTRDRQWMWLSTTGIRRHSLHGSDELEIGITESEGEEAAHVTVSSAHALAKLPLIPGAPTRARVSDYVVEIDDVVARAGVHVRASLERAQREPWGKPEQAGDCGAPAPSRTALPTELQRVAPVVGDLFAVASSAVNDDRFSFTLGDPADDRARLMIEDRATGITGNLPARSAFTAPRFVRVGTMLLRTDPTVDGDVRLRRVKLRCEGVLALREVDRPTFVWLSTIGHHALTAARATVERAGAAPPVRRVDRRRRSTPRHPPRPHLRARAQAGADRPRTTWPIAPANSLWLRFRCTSTPASGWRPDAGATATSSRRRRR